VPRGYFPYFFFIFFFISLSLYDILSFNSLCILILLLFFNSTKTTTTKKKQQLSLTGIEFDAFNLNGNGNSNYRSVSCGEGRKRGGKKRDKVGGGRSFELLPHFSSTKCHRQADFPIAFLNSFKLM